MRLPKIVNRPWVVLLLGFVAGVVCTSGIAGWYVWRATLHAQVDCNLTAATIAADALATLRTHTKAETEQHLEDTVDVAIGGVAAQTSVQMYAPLTLTTTQVEQLSDVKYYRRAFPSTAPDAVATTRYLAGFPDLHVDAPQGCNAPFCRIARGEHAPDEPAPAAH